MSFTISSGALEALKPVNLPKDARISISEDAAIVSSSSAGGAEDVLARTEEIVLIAQTSGGEGYLVIALKESQADDIETAPFRLSSFLAPTLPQALLDKFLVKDLPDSLSGNAEHSSLDVLISVRSGTGLSEKFYDAVLQPLLTTLGLGVEGQTEPGRKTYNVIHTKDANTVKEFAQERWGATKTSDTAKNETLILLSGDGGIVDLLNGSSTADTTITTQFSSLPTIALIPLGTGNALFHSINRPHYATTKEPSSSPSPSPLVLALRALLNGRTAPLPTFTASFSPGAHLVDNNNAAPDDARGGAPVSALTGAIVASYGFHSQLVWEIDTPAYRAHGAARFGMVAAELLKEPHGYRAVVETTPPKRKDGETEVPFNYVLATMVSNLEKTFTISPASEPLDGVLRLVSFGGMTGEETMAIMMGAYGGGKHVGMKGVGYEAVEEVKVTTKEEDARWRKVCIDGTIVELPEGGTMVVEKSTAPRLRVLVLDA